MTRRMEIRRGRISFTTINKFFLLMVLIIVNMIVTQLLIVLDKDLIHEETRLRNGNILATNKIAQYDFEEQSIPQTVTQPKSKINANTTSHPVATTYPEKRTCVPRNDRLHPLCEEQFQEVRRKWNERCYKEYHKLDGTNCSILSYLQNIEPFCQKDGKNLFKGAVEMAEFRTGIEGIMSLLSHKDFHWARKRVKTLWSDWVAAANELKKDKKFANRPRKKLLFYPAALAEQRWILKHAGKGSFLGELVQWTDTITCSYILGHDVTVLLERNNVTNVLQRDDNGCAAKDSTSFPNYDLIFIDIFGAHFFRSYLLGLRTANKYRCKLRLLDSFGTEAEYNYKNYDKKPLPSGNGWGELDLLLSQFFTYFPHSPDNTFLGFAVGSGKSEKNIKKKNQAVIYGKVAGYLQGKRRYLDIIKDYFEIHGTMSSNNSVPPYVKNHGVLSYKNLIKLLRESKVFIGLGFPFEGPAPIEAVSYGAVFLNPMFTPSKSKFNDDFFAGKPNARKITSQNQYLEDFVGKPYVHTLDIKDELMLRNSLKEISKYKTFDAHLPKELTNLGMLERLETLIQQQDLCDVNAPRWPPLRSLYKFLAGRGTSCKDECHKRDLICEPSFFTDINDKQTFKRFGVKCKETVSVKDLSAPSYQPSNGTCYIQENFMYFSCISQGQSLRRVCPCRTYEHGQTIFCDGC